MEVPVMRFKGKVKVMPSANHRLQATRKAARNLVPVEGSMRRFSDA
jgi:hypothetical protein